MSVRTPVQSSLLVKLTVLWTSFCFADAPHTLSTPVHHSHTGNGVNTIVFVHGWLGSSVDWRRQVPAVKGRYQVITLDLPGFGESQSEPTECSIARYSDSVVDTVKAHDLSNVILVAHSMGSAVAIEAANKLGDRTVGVVTIDALKDLPANQTPDQMEAEAARRDSYAVDEANRSNRPDRLPCWRTAIRSYFEWKNSDALLQISSLAVPWYAINSDRSPTDIDSLSELTPYFQLRTISGTSHAVMQDAPDRFNDLLLAISEEMLSPFVGE